jgi:hypothetical protein
MPEFDETTSELQDVLNDTSCPENNLTEAEEGVRRIIIRCPINRLTEGMR